MTAVFGAAVVWALIRRDVIGAVVADVDVVADEDDITEALLATSSILEEAPILKEESESGAAFAETAAEAGVEVRAKIVGAAAEEEDCCDCGDVVVEASCLFKLCLESSRSRAANSRFEGCFSGFSSFFSLFDDDDFADLSTFSEEASFSVEMAACCKKLW